MSGTYKAGALLCVTRACGAGPVDEDAAPEEDEDEEDEGNKSKHAREIARRKKEIVDLERSNVEAKAWFLQGEVSSSKRCLSLSFPSLFLSLSLSLSLSPSLSLSLSLASPHTHTHRCRLARGVGYSVQRASEDSGCMVGGVGCRAVTV